MLNDKGFCITGQGSPERHLLHYTVIIFLLDYRLAKLEARLRKNSISQGDQSWVFVGRTDVEAETPKLWPPDANN